MLYESLAKTYIKNKSCISGNKARDYWTLHGCCIPINYSCCVHSLSAGASFLEKHLGVLFFFKLNVAWKYWQSQGLFIWACFQNALGLYSPVLVHLLNTQKTKRPDNLR